MKKSGTILVVEDEPPMLRLVEDVLRKAGYEVATAANGADGWRRFTELKAGLRLVITDLLMPKVNGVELARMIRKTAPEMPILFISGFADELVFEDAVMKGPTMFLAKPFGAEKLLGEIEAILED